MHAVLQSAQNAGSLPGGYAASLLQALLALAAVCVLAWVVLRWGARRGLGMGPRGGRIRVLERMPLDARRSLYLVEVGGKVLLIGAGDGASPQVLTELDPADIPAAPNVPPRMAFADVLKRLSGRGPGQR